MKKPIDKLLYKQWPIPGFLGIVFFIFCGNAFLYAQPKLEISILQDRIELADHVQVLKDSNQVLTIGEILSQKSSISFDTLSNSQGLSPNHTWWFHVPIQHNLDHEHNWMLWSPAVGMATLYVVDSAGNITEYFSGKHMPAKKKVQNKGEYLHFPLTFEKGAQYDLYLKVWEIDHLPISVNFRLYDALHWAQQDDVIRETIVIFFFGIFGIMMLYNIVLFITIGFPAYLYYALYLLCVIIFVLFSVGPFSYPPIGDPRWIAPIGYLGFGAINIFYFQFGRSFLQLKDLLPKWDRLIFGYILLKLALLIFAQIVLYVDFNISLALLVEFPMLLVDVILSLVFFVALARTKDRLAFYFIGGSASVIVLGLSLAVIGHIFSIRNTYVIFLGSIIVEIIFFSLGLGYKIRKTEQQKLEAEREKRIAQEALNKELSKVNVAFKRFVPHEFIHSLGHKSVLDVQLGDGVEKEVTVLFSDIRGYTALSESMTPKENFDFLNTYLGVMGPVIQQHQGFVNQYYGDGIMALFLNAPSDALQAAQDMLINLAEFNKTWSVKGRPDLKIGIGLHTGPLMMGVIGDSDRMEAGVVADTVNTAARMEGLTKYYQSEIVLSEHVHKGIHDLDDFSLRTLGKVKVKGKNKPLAVYECFGGTPNGQSAYKLRTQGNFNQAMEHYFAKEFAQARLLFEQVLSVFPQDSLSERYLEHCRSYEQEGTPMDWTGVEMMTGK